MTTSTPSAASGLSFPPSTYKKIDPKSFLLRHLQPLSSTTQSSIRPSGRSPDEFRTPTIHTSSLSHANGSAVVRTGDTAIVCGVRAEILTLRGGEKKVMRSGDDTEEGKEEALKKYSLIVPNLELNTGCASQYHPGPPSDLAQALTQRLRHLLLEVLRPVSAESLRIESEVEEGGELEADEDRLKGYWVLYIDTVVISLDGNIFDAAWAAIMAALYDTKLPLVRWDADTESIICNPLARKPLALKELAFASSFGIFTAPREGDTIGRRNTWILADPDDFEESVCDERIVVVMKDSTRIARLEKGGGSVMGPGAPSTVSGVAQLQKCTVLAGERWRIWSALITGLQVK
ncbi:ribosomal protein S5 domain 2-type protein [Peziza echinospora]|nr:ribosomal protein S5 domain 2-type protein [Peziza echinospora]